MDSLSKTFSNKKVFDNFNAKIQKGSKIHIIGANGLGKSTLLNLISGKLLPDSGNLTLNGLSSFSRSVAYKTISGHLSSSELGFISKLSPRQNYNMMSFLLSRKNQKIFINYLNIFHKNRTFEQTLDIDFYKLSSGQKRIHLFFVAICCDPKVLLLDEPFANLDEENSSFIKELLFKEFKKATIVLVEHSKQSLPGFEKAQLQRDKLFFL